MNKKITTSDPIKMVPPMDPTRPPINLALCSEVLVPPSVLLDVAAVGTVTKVVIVVSGNTLTVE